MDVLNKNLFLVKEHLGLFKAANNYDIFDPETGKLVMECREPTLGPITRLLRFTDYKQMTPFDVHIVTAEGERVVRVKRGISLFISTVEVRDHNNELIGQFKQKLFSIGGKFDVEDAAGNYICRLQGSWVGWNFSFANEHTEYAHVTKKWGGLGKELFTSADNYVLQVADSVPENDNIRKLILAAVMCIDMVLKE